MCGFRLYGSGGRDGALKGGRMSHSEGKVRCYTWFSTRSELVGRPPPTACNRPRHSVQASLHKAYIHKHANITSTADPQQQQTQMNRKKTENNSSSGLGRCTEAGALDGRAGGQNLVPQSTRWVAPSHCGPRGRSSTGQGSGTRPRVATGTHRVATWLVFLLSPDSDPSDSPSRGSPGSHVSGG